MAGASGSHRRTESPAASLGPAEVVAVSYEETLPAEAPTMGSSSYHNRGMPASPSLGTFPKGHPLHGVTGKEITISAPSRGGIIQNPELWGMRTTPAKEKKRSIFGFRGRSSSDLNMSQGGGANANGYSQSTTSNERRDPPKNVFGIPLLEAVECSQPDGVDLYLPAVVYRSIEYLTNRGAVYEEGIFRLSGSNITIKALRERFNTEGDVKLLEGDYYDVHAVASLLKLYLRELPNSILSRELHLDFLKALDLTDKREKIATFNSLVQKMPKANYALLHTLSSFLIEIISNQDRNKMNVRNGKSMADDMSSCILHLLIRTPSGHCLCTYPQHSGAIDLNLPD
jgi:RalA-binding protein 1